MSFWKKFVNFITPPPIEEETVRVRARTAKGRFVADDKSTPDVNEAYTTVKKKTRRTKKAK
jgi:hypothetical protein|tara:strand:- start:487 stop:669 length:183 start_codon:yes stop_codon:yes gene_type:complete